MAFTSLQRRVWTLRKLAGLGYAEIGRQVGLPRQAVYTTVRRMERKVQEALQGAEEARGLLPFRAEPTDRFLSPPVFSRRR